MSVAVLVAAAAVVGALDQTTKHVAVRRLAGRDPQAPVPTVGLRLVSNARLGALDLGDRSALATWIAMVAGAGVMLAIVPPVPHGSLPAPVTGIGLAIGGATSNLVDRLLRGYVVDFIVLWRWPAFNLADAAIAAGGAVVAASLL